MLNHLSVVLQYTKEEAVAFARLSDELDRSVKCVMREKMCEGCGVKVPSIGLPAEKRKRWCAVCAVAEGRGTYAPKHASERIQDILVDPDLVVVKPQFCQLKSRPGHKHHLLTYRDMNSKVNRTESSTRYENMTRVLLGDLGTESAKQDADTFSIRGVRHVFKLPAKDTWTDAENFTGIELQVWSYGAEEAIEASVWIEKIRAVQQHVAKSDTEHVGNEDMAEHRDLYVIRQGLLNVALPNVDVATESRSCFKYSAGFVVLVCLCTSVLGIVILVARYGNEDMAEHRDLYIAFLSVVVGIIVVGYKCYQSTNELSFVVDMRTLQGRVLRRFEVVTEDVSRTGIPFCISSLALPLLL